MQKVLIVVDMQNDFIDGALGTGEARDIVPKVRAKIAGFDGPVIYTRDTHKADYLETQEGRKPPVPYCIQGSQGWQIRPELYSACPGDVLDKPGFGSVELAERLREMDMEDRIEEIILVGLCTDICVISNAMLIKAFLPETPVRVDAACCAGVTPQSHQTALDAMAMCQIEILR